MSKNDENPNLNSPKMNYEILEVDMKYDLIYKVTIVGNRSKYLS